MENAAVLAVTGNVIKSNLELHLHFNYLHINFKYKFKPEVGKTILVGDICTPFNQILLPLPFKISFEQGLLCSIIELDL